MSWAVWTTKASLRCQRHVPLFPSCASSRKRCTEPFLCSTSSLGGHLFTPFNTLLQTCSTAAPQKMDLFDLSGKNYLSTLLPDSIIFNFVIIFLKKFLSYHTYMYQLYSSGSNRCAEFSKSWNKIGMLFDHKLLVRYYVFKCAV